MESEQSQQRPCPRCGQVRTEGGGSITQWISSCNCSTSAPDDDIAPAAMCPTCGKRVDEGRSGSFTQWVFRQDLCSCNQPLSKSRSRRTQDDSAENPASWENEEELPVSADKFPLERYKPLKELGKGAAGTVYLCRDRLLGVKVAVKVLNVLTSEKLVSFQNEAKATSKLNHQSIVKILDFGATESGYPYMVMEHFKGQSLEAFLAENGRMETALAVLIFMEISNALQYAHEKGIYHRDVKPSNILLKFDDNDGVQIMIIDFGVAQLKAELQEPTIFQGITLVGTPQYMSPDQANGLPYDQRSEIYSVGCSLFEALTGRTPFKGTTPLEVIGQQASDPPPRLREIVADEYFPTLLEETVARALAKQPSSRQQSMSELSKSLETILQQETRTAFFQPSTAAAKPARLYWTVAALVVVGALSAVVAMNFVTIEKAENKPRIRVKVKKGVTGNGLDPLMDAASNDINFNPKGRIVKLNKFMLSHEKTDRDQVDKKYFLIDDPVSFGLKATPRCTDSTLQSLKNTNLSYLILANTGITDDGVRKLHEIKVETRELDLTKTNVTDACAESINEMPFLRTLVLAETKITDKFFSHLKPIGLRYLELDGCKIGDDGLTAISKNCPDLYKLGLSSTDITPVGLNRLKELRDLRLLYLNNMPIDDETIDVLKTLKLRMLHLTEAKISEKVVRRLPEISPLQLVELTKVPCMNPALYEWLKKNMNPECKVVCQEISADEQFSNINNFIDVLGK